MTTAAVDWVGLGEDGFSRVVQVIVKRHWAEIATVHAPDGRGGDDGIDVLAVDQGDRRRVYQIKFFSDGFSGDRKTTRRKQIQRSFERALALDPPPYEWVLVVPKNLTPGERQFVTSLSKGNGPKITIWDSDDLDVMMARMPDIYNYLVRDQLEDLVSKYRMETIPILGGPQDLNDRLTNLGNLADSLSLNWGVDMARNGQSVEYALRPKHPAAPIDDPIQVELGLRFSSADEEALVPFKRSMGFGARGPVGLPPHVVTRAAVRSSHPLFNTEVANAAVVLESHSHTGPREAEFKFLDSAGTVIASQDAVLEHAGSGPEGRSLAFRVLGRIEVEVDIAVIADDIEAGAGDETGIIPSEPGGPMQLKYRLDGLYPDEIVRCTGFLDALGESSNRCEVLIEGEHAFTFTGEYEVDDELRALASAAYDLAVVQEELHQRFKMPTQIGMFERINLRVTRALLEGYLVESPMAANCNAEVIPNQIDLDDLDRLLAEGRLVDVPMDEFSLELGDRSVAIPGIRAHAHRAKFVDGDDLRRAVEAGQSEPYSVVLRPADHRYFHVYKVDRLPEDAADQRVAWWTLPGIEQHGEPAG